VLSAECESLNRRFFTFHREKRPWILLKWSQTSDGFIDRERNLENSEGINWISGESARQWVHKWRSEEQAILVGTRTALHDDPELTVRHWEGRNPLRLVIDREGRLPRRLKLFNNQADTRVFTSISGKDSKRPGYVRVPSGEDYIPFILDYLHGQEIQSLMVEGGAALLDSFIRTGMWDEARVFTGRVSFGGGLPAPEIRGDPVERTVVDGDVLEIYRNPTA
jgi:diaminohydroxyphosphoribosylaminopyrimidine deaminase/5-amino-6-(5-phosphoribosylamino)uracil reductase